MKINAIVLAGLVSLSLHSVSFAGCQEKLKSGGPSFSETQQFLISTLSTANLWPVTNGNSHTPGQGVDTVSINGSIVEISWHYYWAGNDGNFHNAGNFTKHFDVSDMSPIESNSVIPAGSGVGIQCREGNCVTNIAAKDGATNMSSSVYIPPIQNASGVVHALNHFIELCGGKAPLFQ